MKLKLSIFAIALMLAMPPAQADPDYCQSVLVRKNQYDLFAMIKRTQGLILNGQALACQTQADCDELVTQIEGVYRQADEWERVAAGTIKQSKKLCGWTSHE